MKLAQKLSDAVLKRLSQDELLQMWIERERELCQKDLLHLCREYLGYADITEEVHGPVAEALETWEDLLVLMPRGHLKSSLITIGKTIQFILQNQNVRIKIVNANYGKAVEFVTSIKQHIQNERLVRLFPEILYENPDGQSDLWREDSFNVKRTGVVQGSTVEALGIMTGNVGKHCEILIFDDVHDDKNTTTFEMIERTKQRYRLFLSVLEPGGLRLVIGTRWKREDLYGDLIKQGVRLIRREDIENGQVLFPGKFSFEILGRIKRELGTKFYYMQYKNRVMSDEDIVFKPGWFQFYQKLPELTRVYILCDPAIATGTKNCESVVQTIGQTEDNKVYVMKSDGFQGRVQDIVDKIFLEYLKYEKYYETYVGIEKAGFQHALHQWIEKEQAVHNVFFEVIELEPRGRNKDFRIRRLSPLFERRQIWLHQENCPKLYDQLVEYGGTVMVDHADTLGYLLDVLVEEGGYGVEKMGGPMDDDPYSLQAVIGEEAEMACLDY